MMIVTIGLQFFLRNMYAVLHRLALQHLRRVLTPAGKDFHGLFTYTTRDMIIAIITIVASAP